MATKKDILGKKLVKRFIEGKLKERRRNPNTASVSAIFYKDSWMPFITSSTKKSLAKNAMLIVNFYGESIDEAYQKAYNRYKGWYFLPLELSIVNILRNGHAELDLTDKNVGLGFMSIYRIIYRSDAKTHHEADPEKVQELNSAIHKAVEDGAVVRSPFSGCLFAYSKYRNLMREQGFAMIVRTLKLEGDSYVYG